MNITIRHRLIFSLVLLLFALASVFLSVRDVLKTDPSIDPDQLARAYDGVTRNADWNPAIYRIGGVDMALVPSGCFMMGSTDAQLEEALRACDSFFGFYGCQDDFSNERPTHEVCIDEPFWLDVVEVSNRAYGSRESLNQINGAIRKWDWPRDSVTFDEAVTYCDRRGARLPTEAEWAFAARGPDSLIYPWGNDFDGQYETSSILYPDPVGSEVNGVSWVGVLDLGGSLSEWVSDPYKLYLSDEPATDNERVLRGGNWFSFSAHYLRGAYRQSADPEFTASVVGFRCARDVE